MTISELIEKLEKAKAKFGDLDVVVSSNMDGILKSVIYVVVKDWKESEQLTLMDDEEYEDWICDIMDEDLDELIIEKF